MRARVKNGRWVLDEPAGLPEGTEVEIVTRVVRAPADVYLDDKLRAYIHELLVAACSPKYSAGRGGDTPAHEGEIADDAKARARAAGRSYATPDDIKAVAPEMLRRIVIVPDEARARSVTTDDVIRSILDLTPVP
jgi:MoxR-like ATPase